MKRGSERGIHLSPVSCRGVQCAARLSPVFLRDGGGDPVPFLCEPRLADLREGKRERVKHGGQILDDRGLREETLRRVRPEGLRVVGRHGDKSGVHEPPDTKRRENRFRKLNRVSGDPAAKRYRNALLIKRKGECREELGHAAAVLLPHFDGLDEEDGKRLRHGSLAP